MEQTEKANLQNELDQINRPGGQFHEKWLKRDPDVLKMREGLYQKLWPEPLEEKPPQTDKLDGDKANLHADSDKRPEEKPAESLEQREKAVIEDLRGKWGDTAEANFQASRETENFLFEDPADKKLQEHLYAKLLGPDKDLIGLLAEARERIGDAVNHPLPPAATIAALPKKDQEQLIAHALTRLTGGKLKTPFVEKLLKVFSTDPEAADWYEKIDPAAITWWARIGYRFYRSEQKGK